jgi:hypothetical protein
MTLNIKINTDNAAFANNSHETIKILNYVVNNLPYTTDKEGSLFDYNGNNVGSWKLTGKLYNNE